jgi:flagellar biosynthesis protein FlhG
LAETRRDQAEGLRRMFSADRMRVIHVVAGREGVGRTSVAVNLGLALAKAGRDTLLIDIARDGRRGHALESLGLAPRARAQRDGVIASFVPGPHGLAVLPLALDAPLSPTQAAQIVHCCAPLEFALLTGSSVPDAQLLPIEPQRREVVVVLERASASITEAYALIKRMSGAGVQRSFRVLVNRAASAADAELVFDNMARVARGYLDVDLELMGFVPDDDAMIVARVKRRSLLDGWPEAPAARAFTKLAADVADWPLPRGDDARSQAARVAWPSAA